MTDVADRVSQAVSQAAQRAFGWPGLRPGQLDAIEALLNHTDVLAVMPTGYGKSAIYQLAGLLNDGPTLVVSPLIALQNDQVAGLNDAPDAPDAVAVNSGNSDGENDDAWQRYEAGDAEFLLLSPEQLAKPEVIQRLRSRRPTLFVVDEAHCVSSWGHDFRPDYLRLGEVIDQLGHPTVCALTATGSAPVRDEIVDRLHLRQPLVLTRGFDRPNLRLEVQRHSDDREKRDAVIEQVLALPKPGLLYVSTRRDSERYAVALSGRGLAASAYHAGLRSSLREQVHEAFLDDRLDVVVATSAFGMGIDKRNVRFVVHAAITESLDAYYQEIGRAGRDAAPATTTLHYRQEDLGLRSFFASGAPDPADLARVFATLAASDAPMKLADLASRLDLGTRRTSNLVNLLQEADVADSGRRGVRATARAATRRRPRARGRGVAGTDRAVPPGHDAQLRRDSRMSPTVPARILR
ncbi:RecQ family ATP-dependent DNA helicase [Salinibacterium sp. ZJ454]|uniref:RecQ family ATP-dependent DNA helicase n=1 Tax=Salinibacterium sp. ZJ454 TaxID=2708339 RepID=UPI00326496B0